MSESTSDQVFDPARLEKLQQLALLDTPAEEAFDRLTRLAALLIEAPVALVSLVDDKRQFFKSCVGLPTPWSQTRQTPLSHSFCQHAVRSGQPLIIEDARCHPLVCENLAIRDLNVIAYAGIPLVTSDGFVLGSFCVIDSEPRPWTPKEINILSGLAASVMTEIDLLITIAKKTKANELAEAATRKYQAVAHRLAEEDRKKTQFLAMLAHELRNPLSALSHGVELLMSEPAGDSQIQSIHSIMDRQVQQMTHLVSDLMDASRIGQGKLRICKEPIRLQSVVEEALEVVRSRCQESGHQLQVQFPEEPVIVNADHARCVQIVCNLLGNACKYTPSGGEIRVNLQRVDHEAVLCISDTGVGIPADQLGQIFELFQQIDGRESQQQGGMGIGLTLVRNLVEMHDGTVSATSAGPGKGSEFTMKLPIAEDKSSETS